MSPELPDMSRESASPWATMTMSTSRLLDRLLEAATPTNDNNRTTARRTLKSGGLAPWQAKRVAIHVREHIGSRMKTRELAELVKLSLSHFSRSFAVSFRETPAAYVMRQRLRLARQRMLTTDLSLAEVALDCGFYDQAHFSRVFRRIVGISPLAWRRQFAR